MKLRCTAGNPLAVKAVAAACLAGADLEIESVTGSGFVSALLSSYIYVGSLVAIYLADLL